MDQDNIHPKDSAGSPDLGHIRLACQACQRKKIKCDRHFPCGQCVRSSLQCVPSTRKPRARHTGKRAQDSELRKRISKLENLVESLSGETGAQDETPDSDDGEREGDTTPKEPPTAAGNYMGSSFWSSLTTEVQALREALEEEPPEEDEMASPSSSSNQGNSNEYDLILCAPGSVYVMPGALVEPNPQLSATLCTVFCENANRLFRLFHEPSLCAFMIEGKPYLGYDHTAPCNKALKASVWFAAVNTMSEPECQMLFGQSRADQLQQYRRLVDVSLSQADLMNTNDMATLQALATYMAHLRLTDGSRRMWTMTAMLVRIGRAMGLHHEAVPRSAFLTEIRRRLWHQIRFLDLYVALDRGSDLLTSFGTFDTPLPRNANDSEFDETSTSITNHDSGLTDMSYMGMVYDATYVTHRLTIPESKPSGETWQQRMELAEQFEQKCQEEHLRYCDRSDPFHRLMSHVAGSMISTMKLRAVRPVQKHVSSTPPRVDSPYVLKLATDCLRNAEASAEDPETIKWRWMVWVQWHALAVALAGLCALRDTALANEAWMYVEKAYARNARFVADTRSGMLWKPIEKLYRKASTFRAAAPVQQQQQPLPMDFTTTATNEPLLFEPDLGTTDINWMDFERILEDMSNPNNNPNDEMGMMGLQDLGWSLPPAPVQQQNWGM